MDYKAFVSSTYVDLKDHRAHVIRELRKAGFFVDPMEEWTSAAEEPKVLSVQRLEGCKLCILLIARRRGHVPTGETLSIPQREVAEARRCGIDVLPFVLDDGVSEADWPWDEPDKPAVDAWRKDIREQLAISTFKKTPTTINLSPALTRWVKSKGAEVALNLYLKLVEQEHGTIQFLGLPQLKDNPNALIHRLYVEPALASQQVSPDLDPKEWPATQPVLDVVAEHQRLVVLGDPGSGKSTLVSWIAWQLAKHHREGSSPWTARLGQLIPLPFVLRNLGIGKGVTWETLLRAFLDQPIARLLDMADLHRILDEGRAIVMLDGLDEIGDLAVRLDLRDAVWAAFTKYPSCRWLLTSRIVGYPVERFPDASFNIRLGTGSKFGPPSRVSVASLEYVVPFDDARVDCFADNWFTLREDAEWKRQQMAKELVDAVRAHDSTKKLGRIPNLLTMMALIFRVRARLPHGRALLYNEIAQAYLETIEFVRKLPGHPGTLSEKKRWLARVGFEMQRRRSTAETARQGGKPVARQEILATGEDVRRWVAAAMAESGKEGSDEDARGFVDFLARRSGLLLPRGQDQFAFLHLSFQEYFAATFLQEQIVDPDWRDGGSEGIAAGATSGDVRDYANNTIWRETLVFLVELLAAEQPKWLKTLRACLFGADLAEVRSSALAIKTSEDAERKDFVANNQNRVVLLARLVIDPQAGFDAPERDRAVRACWHWEITAQRRMEGDLWSHSNTIAVTLLMADKNERPAITQGLAEAAQELGIRHLNLRGTSVSDLSPLGGLSGLNWLDLAGTSVSDLSPLAGLSGLNSLDLERTSVSDLSPLARLSGLNSLDLMNTSVSDLSPLARLSGLNSLDLRGTSVSDLSPLAGLRNLKAVWLLKSQQVTIPPALEKVIRGG